MKIGLFFGSFNPMHLGHKVIASYMVEFSDLDKVIFIVSPQNPFKKNHSLLPEIHRLAMVERSIENDFRFKASNIEFALPKPSYTSDTLAHLVEKYPDYKFSLIMGEDNLTNLHKWKNADFLVDNYDIYVYPRPGAKPGKFKNASRIHRDAFWKMHRDGNLRCIAMHLEMHRGNASRKCIAMHSRD